MRMILEHNAEHVSDFTLVPVRIRPNIADGFEREARLHERHLDANVFAAGEREKRVDDRKIARRLTVAMFPHALIDRGEVVQHAVIGLEPAQQIARLFPRDPVRGNAILGLLVGSWRGGGAHDYTSSGGLRSVVFCRNGRFRSRNEGMGGRSTPCGPMTQLSGRLSMPTAFCNSTRPSSKASGRGGQP